MILFFFIRYLEKKKSIYICGRRQLDHGCVTVSQPFWLDQYNSRDDYSLYQKMTRCPMHFQQLLPNTTIIPSYKYTIHSISPIKIPSFLHKYSLLTGQRASFERDREYYTRREKRERREALREQVDFLTCKSVKVCVQKSILSGTNDPLYKSVLSGTGGSSELSCVQAQLGLQN